MIRESITFSEKWPLSSQSSLGFVRTSVVLEAWTPLFAVWPGIVLIHFPGQHIPLKLGFFSFRLGVKVGRNTTDTPEMLLLKRRRVIMKFTLLAPG